MLEKLRRKGGLPSGAWQMSESLKVKSSDVVTQDWREAGGVCSFMRCAGSYRLELEVIAKQL